MSPLEIRRPNPNGSDLIETLTRSCTSKPNANSPLTIHWEEETHIAYVRTKNDTPLEEVPLLPNTSVIVGEKIPVKNTDNVYCVESQVCLKAIDSPLN